MTVLFSDIVGSTQLGERLDAEALRTVLTRYFSAMRSVIEHHGGTVEKFIGDAVMAVFGVPQVREDDALRAVRAAADMRDALVDLNEQLRGTHGVEIQIRTGLNTGEVVVSETGTATKLGAGDAVNVAARFEQAAGAGEILIGEPTYRLVRDAILAEPLDPLALKGKSDPLVAYRVVKVDPAAVGFARRLDAPMVGRERELMLLQGAFERAVSDQACQLFTVLGVGGVGKTRLLDAFVAGIEDRASVLRGRCLAYGDGITFLPIVEAVHQAIGSVGIEDPEEARRRIASLVGPGESVERITEQLAQVLGIAGGEASQEETLWAVRKFFEGMARRRPVVLLLDDLQWAEPTLLQLVEHIADWSVDEPILLACMARPELLDLRPDWGGGKLNSASISLEPLTTEECATLVANLLAVDEVAPEVRARVADASEGHPLYAEELIAMLVDEGRLSLIDGVWDANDRLEGLTAPPTTAALLAARLDRLDPADRDVLERASVIGQVFYREALVAISDAADLDARLASLMRKQFVRPERSDLPGIEALAFRHLLIRDVAYEALTKAARADLHRRFADWLETHAPERTELLGYHEERAVRYLEELGSTEGRAALAERASRHLRTAGDQAFARGDMSATENLLTRATEMMDPGDPALVPALSVLAHARTETGAVAEGKAAIDRAVAVAEALGDELLAARARTARGWLVFWGESAVQEFDEIEGEARANLQMFEAAGDAEGAALAWAIIGSVLWNRCRASEAGTAWRRAVDLFDQAGNDWLASEYLGWLSSVWAWGPAPCDEALVALEALAEEARGRPTAELEVATSIGTVLMFLGDLEGARRRFEASDRKMREFGLWLPLAHSSQLAGVLALLSGNAAGAEAILAPAASALEQMGSSALSIIAAFLAQALYALGRFDAADEAALKALAFPDGSATTIALGVRGMVEARRGNVDPAERFARQALEAIEGTDFTIDRADARIALAEVLELAGRGSEAADVTSEAIALYEQKGNVLQARQARERLDRLAGSGTDRP